MVLGIRPNTKFVYSLKRLAIASLFVALHIEEALVARPPLCLVLVLHQSELCKLL